MERGSPAIARALRRLARRDRAPRRWWHPAPLAPLPGLDPESAKQAQTELASRIRKVLLAQAAFCSFCLLTLATPDSALLTSTGKIPLPFAQTDVDFLTFMGIAPLIIVGQCFLLHVYLRHSQRLGAAATPAHEPELLATSSRGWLTHLGSYFLGPLTVFAFAAKAAPRHTGTWLLLGACGFAAALAFLRLRSRSAGAWRGARLACWVVIVLSAAGAARIIHWGIEGGERPFARPWRLDGAKLEEANLVGLDLVGASFRRARLQRTSFTRAQLRGAVFANADLTGASFEDTDLRDANFSGALLTDAKFRGANLRGARVRDTDLRSAKIEPEQLRGMCFDGTTRFAGGRPPGQLAPHCGGPREWGVCTGPAPAPPPCDRSVVRQVIAPVGGYEAACLGVCSPYYSDRDDDHVLLRVPDELAGGVWIKTVNTGDKSETAERFLVFELAAPATVWVGYDNRVRTPPDWLTRDFAPAGLSIGINEPDPEQRFDLYRRRVAAGEVVLGGNRASGARFGHRARSNYVVIVTRAPAEAK